MTRIKKMIDFYPTVYVKDKVLGNVFCWTFSDSFRQSISLHPYCQDIIESIPYQIWVFQPSCLCRLLTLWLEICVPNDKFGFSGDNCQVKLPAKFWLQIIEFSKKWWRKMLFFLFLFMASQSRINRCYCILFSNLKQKKNTTLFLVELIAVTWVLCILRHAELINLLSFQLWENGRTNWGL